MFATRKAICCDGRRFHGRGHWKNTIVHFSTIILGGGPAAFAVAIHLARNGRGTAILERSHYETQRVGESLPPAIKPFLSRLGAAKIFEQNEHLPSPGIVSVWGSAEPYENNFLFNPYGHGWHVDRRRFDESLSRLAADTGVMVHSGTRVTAFSERESGLWDLEARTGALTVRLTADYLVDATGRARWLSRRLGARPLRTDRLIGLVANIPLAANQDNDRRTWLEAAENGWWYSAVLPGGRMAIAYMTDVDFLPPKPRDLDSFANLQLQSTDHTRLRLADDGYAKGFRIVSAGSYCMDRVAGRNWVAVGDAAMGWDPLSGQGITKALDSGFRAAEALLQVSDTDQTALEEYAKWVADEFQDYRNISTHYYRAEGRWTESQFWERRQRVITTVPS